MYAVYNTLENSILKLRTLENCLAMLWLDSFMGVCFCNKFCNVPKFNLSISGNVRVLIYFFIINLKKNPRHFEALLPHIVELD